jgi:type 1 glutamine amidotransferase
MRLIFDSSRFVLFFSLSFLGVLGVLAVPFLRGSEKPAVKLLLIGSGPDGHPVQTHEYMAGLKIVAKCLKDVPGLEITTVRADEPWRDGPELIARADGVVLFLSEGARWMNHDPKRREALTKLAARGGGLTVLHWAMGTKDAKYIDGCLQLLGGCHGGPDRKYKILETSAVLADRKHPIAAGIDDFRVRDEFYYQLKFVKSEKDVQPLLRVTIDDQPQTVAWCWDRPDGGRSFGFSGLHYHDNWRLAEYRRLVAQGILWTLKKPIPKDGMPVSVTEEDLKLK